MTRGSANLVHHSSIAAISLLLPAFSASACAVSTHPEPAESTLPAAAAPESATRQNTHLDQVWTDDPELAPLVQSAVERWSEATGRQWVFTEGPRVVSWGDLDDGSVGRRIGDDVIMNTAWRDSDWLDQVVVHELGHYFRAGHTGDPWSVMYASIGNVDCLSHTDLAFVCGAWPCTRFEVECDWLDEHLLDDANAAATQRTSKKPY